MMMSLKGFDFGEWTDIVPACIAIFTMPFSYSIAAGIEFGVISFVIIKICTGRKKEISPMMFLLFLVFILKEVFF